MKRMHLIEIADLAWCPSGIRHGVSDYCRFLAEKTGMFNLLAPLLAEALRRTGARQVLDLGSGAAGPWLGLQRRLRELGTDVPVCLTDLYPNLEAFKRASRFSKGAIIYRSEPVDATQVPAHLAGFRTMFQAFHHLRPDQARAVLADAAAKGVGIGVFEGGNRSILTFLAVLPTPIRVFLLAPFIRPFRWSRLFWTYLVPVLPLVLLFDVVVSLLRIYGEPELRDLTAGLDHYQWTIGKVRGKWLPLSIPYLIGVPVEKGIEPSAAADPACIKEFRSV